MENNWANAPDTHARLSITLLNANNCFIWCASMRRFFSSFISTATRSGVAAATDQHCQFRLDAYKKKVGFFFVCTHFLWIDKTCWTHNNNSISSCALTRFVSISENWLWYGSCCCCSLFFCSRLSYLFACFVHHFASASHLLSHSATHTTLLKLPSPVLPRTVSANKSLASPPPLPSHSYLSRTPLCCTHNHMLHELWSDCHPTVNLKIALHNSCYTDLEKSIQGLTGTHQR